MDLSAFNHFTAHLATDRNLKKFGWTWKTYRYFDGKWSDESSTTLTDTSLATRLTTVRREKKSRKRGAQLFHLVPQFDAIVVAQVPAHTRSSKLADFSTRLVECIEYCEHKFDATHDKLTRLLNRTGFERELKNLLREEPAQPGIDTISTTAPNRRVALIAADIDYFKQVNDSYGHQYGDAVLRAFGWRLNEHAKSLASSLKLDLIVARPGGEEFEILVANLRDPSQAGDIAESFRNLIEKDPLPSEDQLRAITRDLKIDLTKCPAAHLRRITASFGYGFVAVQTTDPDQVYAHLKSRADIALYRAKADGRNKVRSYGDIRRKHGKVYAHHTDSDLVVIDIGRDVGVQGSQVYDVYLPNHAGGVALTHNDSRSTRTMGVYPRMPSGRLLVVDAQRDVSFCQVIHRSTNGPFPAGSSLHYVPLGISRPIVAAPVPPYAASASPLADLFAYVYELIRLGATPGLFLYSIRMAGDRSASVEPKLAEEPTAHLINSITGILPPGSKLGYVRKNRIAAVVNLTVADSKAVWEDNLKALDISYPNAVVHCGVWWPSQPLRSVEQVTQAEPEVTKVGDARRWVEEELFYRARVALFVARNKENQQGSERCVFFDDGTASAAISAQRRMRRFDEGIVDYQKLRSIGIDTPFFNNQGGLCMIESRNDDAQEGAERCFQRAANQDPTSKVIQLNLGVALVVVGKYQQALKVFKECRRLLSGKNNKRHWLYHLSYAKSLLETFRQKKSSVARSTLKNALRRAAKVSKPDKRRESVWLEDVQRALHSLR